MSQEMPLFSSEMSKMHKGRPKEYMGQDPSEKSLICGPYKGDIIMTQKS